MEGTSSRSTDKNRNRLAKDTAAYYESLTSDALEEENSTAKLFRRAEAEIDFDREP